LMPLLLPAFSVHTIHLNHAPDVNARRHSVPLVLQQNQNR
jgi:hypothetical protein